MYDLQQRLQHIEKQIEEACQQSGRLASDVHIVAVTKEVSVQRTIDVLEAGVMNLGENRVEGLQSKQATIDQQASWHFIGSLQSRKVKDIINDIQFLHSLDRMSLAKEIQKRAEKPVDCFVQVNVSGEDSKSGFAPDEVKQFIENVASYDKINIIGLMTMAPFTKDEELIRSVFKGLRELRDEIAACDYPHAPCKELSMGMSNDFVIAVEEGATYVRIGTALVGNESEEEA